MTKQDIAENRKRTATSDSYLPIRQRESEVEGIGNRIQELRRNGESIAGFARRVGVPEANIHTYLRGMNPQVDKLVRIARACGVTVDWLATGRGERSAVSVQPVENKETAPRAAAAGGDVLDVDRLSAAIAAIEEGLGGKPLPPAQKAAAILHAYTLLSAPGSTPAAVIHLLKMTV